MITTKTMDEIDIAVITIREELETVVASSVPMLFNRSLRSMIQNQPRSLIELEQQQKPY